MDPKLLAKKIADETSTEMQAKFLKGQDEHGGDFSVKPTVHNIREEALDLIHYTYVLEQHKKSIERKLKSIEVGLSNVNSVDIDKEIRLVRKVMTEVQNL